MTTNDRPSIDDLPIAPEQRTRFVPVGSPADVRRPAAPPPAPPSTGMGALVAVAGILAGVGLAGWAGHAMALQADEDRIADRITQAFAEAPTDQVAVGRFDATAGLLEAGEARGYEDFDAVALLISADDKSGHQVTDLVLSASGLLPATTYPGHLHEAPCSQAGGGHFRHDPEGGNAPPNEIWLTLRTDANGTGITHGTEARWWIEAGTHSVVLHDPQDGEKLVCIDLTHLDPAAIR